MGKNVRDWKQESKEYRLYLWRLGLRKDLPKMTTKELMDLQCHENHRIAAGAADEYNERMKK